MECLDKILQMLPEQIEYSMVSYMQYSMHGIVFKLQLHRNKLWPVVL